MDLLIIAGIVLGAITTAAVFGITNFVRKKIEEYYVLRSDVETLQKDLTKCRLGQMRSDFTMMSNQNRLDYLIHVLDLEDVIQRPIDFGDDE